jgi:hypothetical protein
VPTIGDFISLCEASGAAPSFVVAAGWDEGAAAAGAGADTAMIESAFLALPVLRVILNPSRSILKTDKPFFFIKSINVRISLRSTGGNN